MNARKARKLIDAINLFAPNEGWAIFNECEIQRIDSQDIEGAPQLATDADALQLVQERAANGSALHRAALDLTATSRRPGARSFTSRAPNRQRSH